LKIPVHIAEKLLLLSQGETISSSKAKHTVVDELTEERIVVSTGRIQKKLLIPNKKALDLYLQNKYGINDLKKYIDVNKKNHVRREEHISVSSDSKNSHVRTFKGFLVNCFNPIQGTLRGEPVTLNPAVGMFQFVYDFEDFAPDQSVTIVGVENAENFRYVEKQNYLFQHIQPLFVSRYPQTQIKDLLSWLRSISNNYLHFGDFDFAGIGIYLNEFKKHLDQKATFYVPENIEELIKTYGNKTLYDRQKITFSESDIQEERLLNLIELIHTYKKGLEQEILIGSENGILRE
jgi:hypothetical protein